jgi:penicillin V acylase-like amidase (Ntn superfamily)
MGSYGGVARIHMTVNDRSGKSLAVDYLNGQLAATAEHACDKVTMRVVN